MGTTQSEDSFMEDLLSELSLRYDVEDAFELHDMWNTLAEVSLESVIEEALRNGG
jgi:hypothetical protein